MFEVIFDGRVQLDVEDIWPDGDAPENPTATDVVAVMRRQGGPIDVVKDWNLGDDLRLGVLRFPDKDYAEHER